jgi:hypothetical protein
MNDAKYIGLDARDARVRGRVSIGMLVPASLRDASLRGHSMPPRTTQQSHRPRASDRTMVGNAATVRLVGFGSRIGPS